MIKAITRSSWEVFKEDKLIGYVRFVNGLNKTCPSHFIARKDGIDKEAKFETLNEAVYHVECAVERFGLLEID